MFLSFFFSSRSFPRASGTYDDDDDDDDGDEKQVLGISLSLALDRIENRIQSPSSAVTQAHEREFCTISSGPHKTEFGHIVAALKEQAFFFLS